MKIISTDKNGKDQETQLGLIQKLPKITFPMAGLTKRLGLNLADLPEEIDLNQIEPTLEIEK